MFVRPVLKVWDYKCWERWRSGESSSSLKSRGQMYWRMKWSGTFLIYPRKSVGNWQNACYAHSMLWGEFLILTNQSTCRYSIWKRESAETLLRWASESKESMWEESSISLTARFWIVSRIARESLEAPLHRGEPYSRQGRIWAL